MHGRRRDRWVARAARPERVSATLWRVDTGGEFYDEDFFRTVAASGARVLLIGRRALIALGAPVMTSDYDVWLHFDDVELLNAAFAALDHHPNHTPEDARRRGRYVLENSQRVDVVIARGATASDATDEHLTFRQAWDARVRVQIDEGLFADLPSIDHLIITKRWGSRPRDLVDIEWLNVLKGRPA